MSQIHNRIRRLRVHEMRLPTTRKLIALSSEHSCGDEFPLEISDDPDDGQLDVPLLQRERWVRQLRPREA
jgi:hypothetical protein